jgi:outer membrane protein OmpA-like peptidoglycan-associated protein
MRYDHSFEFPTFELEAPFVWEVPAVAAPTLPDCPPQAQRVDCPKPGTQPSAIIDYFDFDKFALRTGCHALMVEEIVRRIIQSQSSTQPICSVLIAGHTDKVGDDNYNFTLGWKRATTVLNRLCGRLHSLKPGLPRQIKFQITSCGERQTKATAGLSRRVEVFLPAPPRPVGCPPFKERIRLHLKILVRPTRFTIPQMLASMRQLYEAAGFLVEVVSCEIISAPALEDLDIRCPGSAIAACCPFPCATNTLNPEHIALFTNRNNVMANELAAYFVKTTIPGLNGCCAFPVGSPGVIVTAQASQWSLGHEIGHVLGVSHVVGEICPPAAPPTRLMTGCGTNLITGVPTLTAGEITNMFASAITQAC